MELARGDRLMTVRTYHPLDEIRYPEGPFAPERPLEEAITLAQQFIKDWNVLWQEAIDVDETLITGNIQLSATGEGHYDILKGKYRVRDVNNPPVEAKKDYESLSFISWDSINNPIMKEVILSLRNLPGQLGLEDNQGVIVEFNLQSKPVGVLNKPLLLWEWRLPIRHIEVKITESVHLTDSVDVSVIRSGHRLYGIGPLSLPEERDNERRIGLLGSKGANLWLMKEKGLPVPAGFVLSTSYCREFRQIEETPQHSLTQEIDDVMARLTELAHSEVDQDRPLMVSVRSSPIVSMPGVMTTVINVGATPAALSELAQACNNTNFAWDVGRRFLDSFLRATTSPSLVAKVLDFLSKSFRQISVPKKPDDLKASFEHLFQMIGEFGIEIPATGIDQITKSIEAVLASWSSAAASQYRANRGIREDLGTAVIVQQMVYGNLNSSSGSGVGFSRDPSTGEKDPLVEYLACNQGEDLVAGREIPWSTTRFRAQQPNLYQQITSYARELEQLFREMQEFEFTVENNHLFLLQARAGKRSAVAELRITYDLLKESLISKEEAIRRIKRVNLDELVYYTLHTSDQEPIGNAVVASPGSAAGEIVLSSELAIEKVKAGNATVLVKEQLSKDDYEAMRYSRAILTARGGKTSHAAVLARELGCTALVGCEQLSIDYKNKSLTIGHSVLKEGDNISLDGNSGLIYKGKLPLGGQILASGLSDEILNWARKLHGTAPEQQSISI